MTSFKAYMENVRAKAARSPEEFWRLASKKGLAVAKHSEMLAWLKSKGSGWGKCRRRDDIVSAPPGRPPGIPTAMREFKTPTRHSD